VADDPVIVTTERELNPPTAPSGLTVDAVDGSKVLLRWTSSTDDVAPGTFPRPPVQGAWVRQLEPGTNWAPGGCGA
jgi:hypothetical protein